MRPIHSESPTCPPSHDPGYECGNYSNLSPYESVLILLVFATSLGALAAIGVAVMDCVMSFCSGNQTRTNVAAPRVVVVRNEEEERQPTDTALLTL